MITRRTTLGLIAAAALPARLRAAGPAGEPPLLAPEVEAGRLPPMAERLPRNPRVMPLAAMGRAPGRYGGSCRMLVGGARDVRYMPYFGYARLVGYDHDLKLVPDILAGVEVEEGRRFTFRLRAGHRWSDGHPFTSADFAYVWDDMFGNKTLYRGGPPADLRQDGEVCSFSVLDDLTVRYEWSRPMPDFLPKLAQPAPLVLAMPAHYMRRFHESHADPESLAELIKKHKVEDWRGLHIKMGRQNRPENPDLPVLDPWVVRTAPPADRFVFERNPYYHRVDEQGRQLPYIDSFVLNVASSEVIAAKTATGEADLQGTAVAFSDYTHFKHAEARHGLKVALWRRTQGSAVALLPNLTCADPVWAGVFRDVRVRRAMSVAIDREEINKVLFYGLARESADTVLPESPLYRPEYAGAWAQHDPALASQLLDAAGLAARGPGGIRKLPDGRQMGIVVETAGESAVETDTLALIADHFRAVGIALYIRTSQRDIFRKRALAGQVVMAAWQGLDNAVPTADMPPDALAPTADDQVGWPLWGQHHLSGGSTGSPPDYEPAAALLAHLHAWRHSATTEERAAAWHAMLALRADQVFSIGTVNGALQPVVRSARLANVPDEALWGFEPTSYFGAYAPDTFFWAEKA